METLLDILGPGGVIIGLAMFVAGWRGRRLDDHPWCRKCRFDLFGASPQAVACPECGANLKAKRAVKKGQRKRRRGVATFGAMVLMLGITAVGAGVWGSATQFNWNTIKPVWWLVNDTRHPTLSKGALDELAVRLQKKKLTRTHIHMIIDEAVAQKSDISTWYRTWSPILEKTAILTLADNEHINLVFDKAIDLQLEGHKPWREDWLDFFQKTMQIKDRDRSNLYMDKLLELQRTQPATWYRKWTGFIRVMEEGKRIDTDQLHKTYLKLIEFQTNQVAPWPDQWHVFVFSAHGNDLIDGKRINRMADLAIDYEVYYSSAWHLMWVEFLVIALERDRLDDERVTKLLSKALAIQANHWSNHQDEWDKFVKTALDKKLANTNFVGQTVKWILDTRDESPRVNGEKWGDFVIRAWENGLVDDAAMHRYLEQGVSEELYQQFGHEVKKNQLAFSTLVKMRLGVEPLYLKRRCVSLQLGKWKVLPNRLPKLKDWQILKRGETRFFIDPLSPNDFGVEDLRSGNYELGIEVELSVFKDVFAEHPLHTWSVKSTGRVAIR